MKRKPLIGIGATLTSGTRKRTYFAAYRAYADAVEAAGGTAVILAPHSARVTEYTRLLDGLLLSGGDDIHPKHYRQPVRHKLSVSPDERTQFEIELIRAFLKADKPVLAICLGIQTLNVALGGTLVQDLPSIAAGLALHRDKEHFVEIAPGTRLGGILGTGRARVNSSHHQAVDRVGKGLVVSARSPDGVIEGVEVSKKRFAIGVQWHPETIPTNPTSKRLFRAFVSACC